MKISQLLKIRKPSGNRQHYFQKRNFRGPFEAKDEKKVEKASRRDFAKVKTKLLILKVSI